jgi:ABC-type Fe3+/spermidine/putrescine transport system ATPase subunit
MVFQNYALFPHLTIEQNISFGLRRHRFAPAEIAKRLAEVLDIVGLAGFDARLPSELSGGQQQRVAIARAIAFQPHLLLLDEPMSNLDAQLRVSMRAELVAIVARIGITAICVTHDQTEALSISDRIVVLAQGRVQQIGSPHEVYNRPANEFVAKFIGQSNFLRYRVTEGAADGTPTGLGPADLCALPDASLGGGEAVLFLLRPEDIRMSPLGCGPAGHSARVAHADYMGSFSLYRIAVGAEELLVQQSTVGGTSVFRTGDPVVVSWDPAALVRIGA